MAAQQLYSDRLSRLTNLPCSPAWTDAEQFAKIFSVSSFLFAVGATTCMIRHGQDERKPLVWLASFVIVLAQERSMKIWDHTDKKHSVLQPFDCMYRLESVMAARPDHAAISSHLMASKCQKQHCNNYKGMDGD